MTDKQLDVLINIIGAVESGGQIYGNRRYDAYAAPYTNSSQEKTVTLGWSQNYGYKARELCQRIFDADNALFRKNDSANIEKRLSQNWVSIKWNPTTAEKAALLKIITTDVGKKIQDDMFKEDMETFINDAIAYGISDVGAQMMYCEIRHLGGKSPTERIFKRATKPYTADTVYASLLLDQNDTSNDNQVGDKKFQSRHQKCVEWIHKYVYNTSNNTSANEKEGDSMTKDEAIQAFISIAKNEVGYLEKASNSQLDSKTGNAGSKNYTKYWRDVYPQYQAQAWCACFVSWCLMQLCGKEIATKMLKHWPFVYCPTLGNLHTKNANPKVGDIVLFYRNGTFAHTGIVTKVSGDQFWTIEGNASTAAGITPNGGGVVKKTYYNSQLPGTKFVTLDWSLVTSINSSNSSTSTNTSTSTSTSTSLNESVKWTGTTTSKLKVRTWAGTENGECSFSPLKKGAQIGVCDVVQAKDGSNWYFIEYDGKKGFVSAKFVKKVTESTSSTTNTTTSSYSKTQFVKDVQKAIGAGVDGIAGSETLSKTVTVSANKNSNHAVVKPIQKYLYALGYTVVGTADGNAGPLFTKAVNQYQKNVLKYSSQDGEITAKGNMWKSLLGML